MLFFIGLTLTGYTNQETMKEIVVKDAIEIGSSFHENYAQNPHFLLAESNFNALSQEKSND